jgi:hypothetical protein
MGSAVTTVVDLITTIITTYWPYIIVFSVLGALIAMLFRAAHLGTGKGR